MEPDPRRDPAGACDRDHLGRLSRAAGAGLPARSDGRQSYPDARAFGLSERKIILRYGLRIRHRARRSPSSRRLRFHPVECVFVETVFSRPGIGTLITAAVQKRNYPVVMGTVLFMTAFYLMVVDGRRTC